MFFRTINTRLWASSGHFMKALSKRPRTTTWIWNLHDHAHVLIESGVDTVVYTRKVFSSNVAHLSLVFFWLGGIHFHGAYFSTYETWLKDPKHSAAGTCLFHMYHWLLCSYAYFIYSELSQDIQVHIYSSLSLCVGSWFILLVSSSGSHLATS